MYVAIAFLIFCVVCTVLAFARHPIYGFYFYLATFYVYPPGRWWGYAFGETRWSLIAAGVAILAILTHRGKLQPKPSWYASVPALAIIAYCVWMWIQSPWVLAVDEHSRGTILVTKYAVAYWIVYRIVDTKERVQDLLIAHLLGCTLLGILAYTTGRTGDRLDGVGGPGLDDSNTLAMYFVTGAIVGFGCVLTQTGWRRWLSLGSVVITLEGLVLTNTRGAVLALVAGGVTMMVFKAKAHRRLFWSLAIVGAIGFASIIDEKFVARMMTVQDGFSDSEDADASARSRGIIMGAQLRMFRDHPMGTGHRGTGVLSARYLDERWLTRGPSGIASVSSHNTFLTTLVEQGVPGAALFIWLTAWTLLAILRMRQHQAPQVAPDLTTLMSTIAGALAAIFVAGFTVDFLLAEVQYWLFATFVTVGQLVSVHSRRGALHG